MIKIMGDQRDQVKGANGCREFIPHPYPHLCSPHFTLPINTAPIVSETLKKIGKLAMDLSMLGVPPARGVGHKAISRWLLASSTICSNYFALSQVCVAEALSRGYTVKGSGM